MVSQRAEQDKKKVMEYDNFVYAYDNCIKRFVLPRMEKLNIAHNGVIVGEDDGNF